MLTGYEAARAMPQPNPTALARFSRTVSRCASSTSGIPREMRTMPQHWQEILSFVNRKFGCTVHWAWCVDFGYRLFLNAGG